MTVSRKNEMQCVGIFFSSINQTIERALTFIVGESNDPDVQQYFRGRNGVEASGCILADQIGCLNHRLMHRWFLWWPSAAALYRHKDGVVKSQERNEEGRLEKLEVSWHSETAERVRFSLMKTLENFCAIPVATTNNSIQNRTHRLL
jgi:hypothetical protein